MAVTTQATLNIPGDSQITVTLTMTLDDWTVMRDDIAVIQSKSVPLASLQMQIDAIVSKARAQIS